jgi:aspartate/methionine/tyrosine aminotransferase
MGRFADSGMSGLVDVAVRYDLAESTGPALRMDELGAADLPRQVAELALGYGGSRGDAELRGLIGAETGVDASDVLVTAGASAALFLAALVAAGPGGRVVCTTPCFPPARTVPKALGAEVVDVALRFDDRYRLDVDAVAAALTPDTGLVSLASPQNPSGIRIAEADLRSLLDEVERRAPRAVVLVDETYRHTTFGAAVPASVAGISPRIITCASLSKSHGAAGLRIGWLTATDPELAEQLRRAKFETMVCTGTADELVAAEILRSSAAVLAPRRAALTAALDTLNGWAARHAELVDLLPPDGGALCCLRLRTDTIDDEALARFPAALAERDTRVAPGSWFGETDRVFRLGFGHLPAELFGPALDRLGDALHAIARERVPHR